MVSLAAIRVLKESRMASRWIDRPRFRQDLAELADRPAPINATLTPPLIAAKDGYILTHFAHTYGEMEMASEIWYSYPRLGREKSVFWRVGGLAEIPPWSCGNRGPPFAN